MCPNIVSMPLYFPEFCEKKEDKKYNLLKLFAILLLIYKGIFKITKYNV